MRLVRLGGISVGLGEGRCALLAFPNDWARGRRPLKKTCKDGERCGRISIAQIESSRGISDIGIPSES